MRLGFGFSASSNFTSSRKVSKPRKAGLVHSSLISREMDVALFLYRNICTEGAFVS